MNAEGPGTSFEAIVDALLYSVSHDLRSPLLTVSLSSELLEEALPPPDERSQSATVAMDSLKHGAADLDRMITALVSLSRARRRELNEQAVPLRAILGGHLVVAELEAGKDIDVAVDAMSVRELLDHVGEGEPMEVAVELHGDAVHLAVTPAIELPELEHSPLLALCFSLQYQAGTIVEQLSVSQVLLERQGAGLAIEDGHLNVMLPLSERAQ